MKNLNEDIKTRNFRPVYLFYGDEAYLKSVYKNKLKNAVLAEGDTMNLTVFEGKDCDPGQIIAQAETMLFFADRRLIIVENSGFFKSASPELAGYIPQMPPETILLFVENEVEKRGKLYKTVNSCGRVTEMARQDAKTLTSWVLGMLKKEKKRIQRSTLDLFLASAGNDMENISNELEKLLCYTVGSDVILREDVEAVCTVTVENKVFDMINAMAEKQQKKALDMFYDLLSNKERPLGILYLMARQFNQLCQIKELRVQGFDREVIAQKMGVQSFVVRRGMNQAAHFEKETLRQAVVDCVEAETAVKTGRMGDQMAVEMILIRYSASA